MQRTNILILETGYSFPKVIKELSGSKASRNQEKIIAAKLQRVFHSSLKKIIRGEMRMLARMAAKSIKDNKDSADEIYDYMMSTYLLDSKEVDFMLANN